MHFYSIVALFKSHDGFELDGDVVLHVAEVLLSLGDAEFRFSSLEEILLRSGIHIEPLLSSRLEAAVVGGVQREQLRLNLIDLHFCANSV